MKGSNYRPVSSTIHAKNQASNENIDKVIRILRRNFLIPLFVLKSGFASEWLRFTMHSPRPVAIGEFLGAPFPS